MKNNITAEELRELLHYNPETGVFVWRERGRDKFTSDHEWKRWNTRYANTVAGGPDGQNYLAISIYGRDYKAHSLAWLYVHGHWPADQMDHINHVRDDNRIENLREATNKQNCKNRSINKNNTSGHNGVCWDRPTKKWKVQISHSGKLVYGGIFADIEDALARRKELEAVFGFHENHGQTIDKNVCVA